MPARKLPKVGDQFGSWTFLGEFAGRKWRCQCVCGTVHWPNSCHVRAGDSSSCRSCSNTLHGATGTVLYSIWCGMKTRCTKPGYEGYAGYGGRGITVCAEWMTDFQAFAAHVGPRPTRRHTLDRIKNDEGYCPGNVQWALPPQQSRNMRSNHWITIADETLVATDWCRRAGISLSCAHNRVKKLGWTWERAVTTPPMR